VNTDTYFKALDGYHPAHGGDGRYPGVGRWTRHLDPSRLEACEYGFHLTKGPQVLSWLAPTLYIAEPCSEHPPVDAGDKWVTCRVRLVEKLVRWDERTARLFAADCAESVLLGERASGREPDERSWNAVAVARRFAIGDASAADLAAAGAAAWAAARAAGDAAGDAAAWAAAWAAWAAARAAWAAARAAAWAAARDSQYQRLVAYLTGGPIPEVEALYGRAA
jgi:hypothetical protein